MRRVPDSERLYELVGRNLARRRREARCSQTQLAKRCGLARGSVANIESGNQRPTLHTLWILANALGIDVRSLLPAQDELLGSEGGTTSARISNRLKKVAGNSQSQVASFIATNREKVSADVDDP